MFVKQDYAINADYNIGDLSTNHSFLLNGRPIEGKTYIGDETTIHVDDDTNVISAIANALIPTGTIVPYVGNTAPNGWLMCDGQILENNDVNAKLWNLLHQNSNFCTGDDVHLPDLKGRFIKGVSSDTTQIGKTETSALPNIKGNILNGAQFYGVVISQVANGAFYASQTTTPVNGGQRSDSKCNDG